MIYILDLPVPYTHTQLESDVVHSRSTHASAMSQPVNQWNYFVSRVKRVWNQLADGRMVASVMKCVSR